MTSVHKVVEDIAFCTDVCLIAIRRIFIFINRKRLPIKKNGARMNRKCQNA